MRTRNIKVSLEIPVPIDKPDLNNVMYAEDAIRNACKAAKGLPIIMYDSNNEAKVKGVTNSVEYKDGYILVNGYLFYGGTEEAVIFDDDNKIVSMELVSFGISD